MPPSHPIRTCHFTFALLALAGSLLLSACQLRSTPLAAATPSAQPQATPTSDPTPAIPRVMLVAPSGADPRLAQSAELALQELAAQAGMDLVRQDSLPQGDATDLALLLALAPDPGLQAWAESHPQTPAAGLGILGLEPTPNVWVVAPDGLRYDQLGFALGYLAALTTPEYRVGALARDGAAETLALARGFLAGGTFYCGLCRPLHPPYLSYPQLLEGANGGLADVGVNTLLVAPAPGSLADLGLPASSAIGLMGTGQAPGDLAPLWMASADFDVEDALRSIWQEAQKGQAGSSHPLRIRLHSIDPARVSAGRLEHMQALLQDLADGRIDTGVDPLTGQPR